MLPPGRGPASLSTSPSRGQPPPDDHRRIHGPSSAPTPQVLHRGSSPLGHPPSNSPPLRPAPASALGAGGWGGRVPTAALAPRPPLVPRGATVVPIQPSVPRRRGAPPQGPKLHRPSRGSSPLQQPSARCLPVPVVTHGPAWRLPVPGRVWGHARHARSGRPQACRLPAPPPGPPLAPHLIRCVHGGATPPTTSLSVAPNGSIPLAPRLPPWPLASFASPAAPPPSPGARPTAGGSPGTTSRPPTRKPLGGADADVAAAA